MFLLNLPPNVENCLNAVCRQTGRSRDEHVREAILDYRENFEDAALAEMRLAAVKQGGETIALAELPTRHGLQADGDTTG